MNDAAIIAGSHYPLSQKAKIKLAKQHYSIEYINRGTEYGDTHVKSKPTLECLTEWGAALSKESFLFISQHVMIRIVGD